MLQYCYKSKKKSPKSKSKKTALDLSKVKIPEELLDPLTQQLMKDPVRLPCSGANPYPP
jgi:hypothetical protein